MLIGLPVLFVQIYSIIQQGCSQRLQLLSNLNKRNATVTLSTIGQGSGQRENVNTSLALPLLMLLPLPGAPSIVGFSCGSQRKAARVQVSVYIQPSRSLAASRRAQLLAIKLRKYPESMRARIMYQIDGLILENPCPVERPSSAYSSHSSYV